MPKKEYTYVKCKWCTDTEKSGQDTKDHYCTFCANTGEVINPLEFLCNMCGENMCPIRPAINEQKPLGLVDAHVIGGYDSYHLLDMSCYEFSFCEKCLRQMFIQCKIKPNIHDSFYHYHDRFTGSPDLSLTWERDQHVYEYKIWTDEGGHHQAYLNGQCNTVKDCPNAAIYTVWLSDHFTEDSCCEEHAFRWTETVNAELVKFIPNILKPFL